MKVVNLWTNKSSISSYISSTLLNEMEENIKNNKKTLLYLNKRWEFSSLICKDCQELYKCKNCDCCLTVHKPNNLVCHICLYSEYVPSKCKNCKSNGLEKIWIWTQQLEDIVKNYFDKKTNIFRFDSDNIKTVKEKASVLDNIDNADIIIWTKMITTGFNIKNLWLIWVILLEQELQIPKYDTEEKVYQNITQLIWRWNRVWEKTDIIIQSFIPDNEIIQSITAWNYKEFFVKTINERKLFNYPPFTESATLEYKHKDKDKSKAFIWKLKEKLDIHNKDKKIEIKMLDKVMKKYNSYFSKILLKWDDLRWFLECIKWDILRNSNLVVIFD